MSKDKNKKYYDLAELFDEVAQTNPKDPNLLKIYGAQTLASDSAFQDVIENSRDQHGIPDLDKYLKTRINHVDNYGYSGKDELDKLREVDSGQLLNNLGGGCTEVAAPIKVGDKNAKIFAVGKNGSTATASKRLETGFERNGMYVVVDEDGKTMAVNVFDLNDQSEVANAVRMRLHNPIFRD